MAVGPQIITTNAVLRESRLFAIEKLADFKKKIASHIFRLKKLQ